MKDMTSGIVAGFLVLLLAVLLVLQGGFYVETSAVCALAYGIILTAAFAVQFAVKRFRGNRQNEHRAEGETPAKHADFIRRYLASGLCLAIAFFYIASAAAHGLGPSSYLECMPWVLAALCALTCASLPYEGRAWLLKAICWLGVVSAWVGVAISAGIAQTAGTYHADRLQFFFEYANAAGAWFSCVALQCFQSEDSRLKRCSIAPLTALLLTQSMGSMLLFSIVAIACILVSNSLVNRSGVKQAKAEWAANLACFLIQGVLATSVFVVFNSGVELSEGIGALLFLFSSCVFYKLWPRICGLLTRPDGQAKLLRLLLFSAILVGLCAAPFLLSLVGDRIAQASATFAERLVQAKDALGLLAENPLLGIGPDQWQYVYPAIQSADYKALLVHCGYLQLGLDAGVVVPILLLTVMAHSAMRAFLLRRSCLWPPLAFLLLHSFVDFDLQFAFFQALIAVLASLQEADAGRAAERCEPILRGCAAKISRRGDSRTV